MNNINILFYFLKALQLHFNIFFITKTIDQILCSFYQQSLYLLLPTIYMKADLFNNFKNLYFIINDDKINTILITITVGVVCMILL